MRLVRSFKLHPADTYGRVVPLAGEPMSLRNERAARALALAAPMLAALESFEPGVRVRTLSLDLERPRLLATLHDEPRPRVVRLDAGPALDLVVEAAAPLLAFLDALVAARVSS